MSDIFSDSVIEWNSKELNAIRKTMVARGRLTELGRKKSSAWMVPVGIDLLIICLSALISELYFSLPLYVFAVMIIGARQIGIGSIALHEAAHVNLAEKKRHNDLFGMLMLGALTAPIIGGGLKEFRDIHLKHHRYALTDMDPDYEFVVNTHKRGRWATIGHFLLLSVFLLSGVAYVLALVRTIFLGEWKCKFGAIFVLSVCVLALVYKIFWLKILLFYWFVPLATWAMFVNAIRVLAEHYPANAFGEGQDFSQSLRTRDITPSWFDKFFVTTRNTNLHLSHHLFPSVPFYNLEKLHCEISKSSAYKKYAHQTKGYHRFMYEYFYLRFSL